ncbi:glutamate receptor 1 [Orussus abietinus]|uniref:glutamate receptor 1 n=1 Tax=Orussus abietinus TaxID=222816 RepID=UPI000C715B86|nr:glutamate receptor 1 [Orussus abietinus]
MMEHHSLYVWQFSKVPLAFNESYNWLLLKDGTELPSSLLAELPLSLASELTIALRQSDSYVLYDAYNPSWRHGGHLNMTYMGNWTSKNGLTITLTQQKYHRRADLHGLLLNFSIVVGKSSINNDLHPFYIVQQITHRPPHMDLMTYISSTSDPNLDSMSRFGYLLMKHLQNRHNFSMNILPTKSWGYLINGSFDGMMRHFIDGISDAGITPAQMKPERIHYVDLTVKIWVAKICFLFRHPKKSNLGNKFIKPFTPEVWWTTVALGIICWFAMSVTILCKIWFGTSDPLNDLDNDPVMGSGLMTIAMICQQGSHKEPRTYSGRIVFLACIFFSLMLYQFYSASIVGSLLAEPPRYIKTLKDLLDSDMEIGIEDISYTFDFLHSSTDPVVQEFNKKRIIPNGKRSRTPTYDIEEGLQKVKKGGFAYHIDTSTAYKIIQDTFTDDEICDLQDVHLFSPRIAYLATAKNSPFKEILTYGTRQMVESGLIRRQYSFWSTPQPRCFRNHNTEPSPVTFDEFVPVIFLLLIGIMVSIGVAMTESHVKCQARKDFAISRKYTQYN